MNRNTELLFNELYDRAKEDPNIIGFFLGGSRGKGLISIYSDYDVYIIVKDSICDSYKLKYPKDRYEGMDLMIYSLSELKNLYSWGDPDEFGRYSFVHINVLIDKIGQIQNIINDIAKIPEKEVKSFITSNLDAYINFFYRSLKCIRDGNAPAARLEAAYAVPFFLGLIFAIHNGRLRPYYKYLKWELENYPLNKVIINTDELIDSLMKILDNADCIIQQKLMKIAEEVCRKEGYGYIFEEWGKEYKWMMTFNPKSY